MTAGAKGYVLARLFCTYRRPFLVVTPDARQRDLLYDDLACFLSQMSPTSEGTGPLGKYAPPVATPAAAELERQRLEATYVPLWRLWQQEAVVVVTDAASLQYPVFPPAAIAQRLLSVRVGTVMSPQRLAVALVERGYRRVSLVEGVGEFALRGSILDVFPPTQRHPLRLEFFGDEIETIRTFLVDSQTSVAALQQAVLVPLHPLAPEQVSAASSAARLRAHLLAHGWPEATANAALEHWQHQSPCAWPWGLELFFCDMPISPLSYLPNSGILCCVDAEDLALVLQQPPAAPLVIGETQLPRPAAHLISPPALLAQLQQRADVLLRQYAPASPAASLLSLHLRGVPQFFGQLERFVTQLRRWQAEGYRVLILCRFPLEVQRMHEFLATYELGSRVLEASQAVLEETTWPPGTLLLAVGDLSQGFVFPELKLVVLRQVDIFGEKKRPAPPPRLPRRPLDLSQLERGERVVHVDYGIGIYRGMTRLKVGDDDGDFMEIEYAEGAKLYVPAYRLNLVQKYIGHDGAQVPLDRLGGASWGPHQSTGAGFAAGHGRRARQSARRPPDTARLQLLAGHRPAPRVRKPVRVRRNRRPAARHPGRDGRHGASPAHGAHGMW
ncbi:MAG: hypothetical protein KatS3mg131_0816 [Candidatus Tectimicrobiota bacterium]|nr:MAG: hypothetical protein KatS3mg131_0816 [Candidatus Tectomicrobia bacterium]